MRKNKNDLVKSWLEKARRDLVTAKTVLISEEPFPDVICFHAQQSAEKYLKAYLTWRDIEFHKTHALEDLILLAAQKEPDFFQAVDRGAVLSPYAVEIRYPEIEHEPSLEDAKKAIKIVEEVRDLIFRKLPGNI